MVAVELNLSRFASLLFYATNAPHAPLSRSAMPQNAIMPAALAGVTRKL